MKTLPIIFVALALAFVLGCDGDGGGDGAIGSEETPTEPGDAPDTGPETIVLDSGTVVDVFSGTTIISSVTVTEPGTLQCWCTWSGSVPDMSMRVVQTGIVDLLLPPKGRPLELDAAVNQYMVDQGGNFVISVEHTTPDYAQVEYRIEFTPN